MTSLAFDDNAAPAPATTRALQQALRTWDQLLEWLPIGVFACDCDGNLIQYNQRAAELWACPASGGRTLSLWRRL